LVKTLSRTHTGASGQTITEHSSVAEFMVANGFDDANYDKWLSELSTVVSSGYTMG
jgi:hypothetical protein